MRIVREDRPAAAVGFLAFFLLLTSLSILRPVRDAAGVEPGLAALPWMFAATLPLAFGAAVLLRRLGDGSGCVTVAYRIFAAGLVVAGTAMQRRCAWAPGAIFVWISVCNLSAVSLLWARLTDAFERGRAARCFGLVAAGGTAGSVAGPLAVEALIRPLGPAGLVILCALLLELAARAAARLPAASVTASASPPGRPSRLLPGLSGYVFLMTATATFLYFDQARIVAAATADTRARMVLFARVDLAASAAVAAAQLLLAPFVLRGALWRALAVLPAITAAGFAALAVSPSLGVIAVTQALRKAAHFGVERPAREVLCTALPARDKYGAKAFVDIAVYRGGDAIAAALCQALAPGAKLPAALALCGLWLLNARALARRDLLPAGRPR